MSWHNPSNPPEPGLVVRCHGYFRAYQLDGKWYPYPGECAPVLWAEETEAHELPMYEHGEPVRYRITARGRAVLEGSK